MIEQGGSLGTQSALPALSPAPRFSRVLKNVRNFRNKNIAHATALTDHERKSGPVPRPKGGDEGRLLHVTLKILERLDLCIRGVLVNWSDSEQIARKDAEALWQGVTIKVLR
jgi:hypothetical protein